MQSHFSGREETEKKEKKETTRGVTSEVLSQDFLSDISFRDYPKKTGKTPTNHTLGTLEHITSGFSCL